MTVGATEKEISSYSWCDAIIDGITWENDGRDLVLKWKRDGKNIGVLTCTWAHTIFINLKTGNNSSGGTLLTWDASFTQTQNKEWRVMFDFASQGEINFECHEIFFAT